MLLAAIVYDQSLSSWCLTLLSLCYYMASADGPLISRNFSLAEGSLIASINSNFIACTELSVINSYSTGPIIAEVVQRWIRNIDLPKMAVCQQGAIKYSLVFHIGKRQVNNAKLASITTPQDTYCCTIPLSPLCLVFLFLIFKGYCL